MFITIPLYTLGISFMTRLIRYPRAQEMDSNAIQCGRDEKLVS